MISHKLGKRKTSKAKPRKSKKLPLAIGLLIVVVAMIATVYLLSMNDSSGSNIPAGKVRLQTSMGDITIQLREDRPITTGNFKNLIQQGLYNGTIFHRVIPGFMIQGGDPTGTGYGDPSIPNIQDELDGDNQNNYGTVTMAKKPDPESETGKSLPNTGSSQFFINVADNNDLDAEYSVFGIVISGMNVVHEISQVATDADSRPVIDVTLIDAEIIS